MEDSFIITNDNLNAEFLYAHLQKISGNLFNLNQNQIIENIGDSLRLKYFHSPFNIFKLFFLFFDSFDAYILNSVFTRYIAFIGVYKLLNDYFKINSSSSVYLISTSFAILPVYTSFGITILGQPLLLWAFLNLANANKLIQSYLIIIVFVFYSNFQLIFPFAIFWLIIYLLYNIFSSKKISTSYIIGLIVFIISTIIANYSIISTLFLEGDERSFRLSRSYLDLPSISGSIYLFLKTLFFGDLVSSLFISIPIFLLIIYFLVKRKLKKEILLILGIIIFNITIHVLSPHIAIYLGEKISIFKAFGFGRFIFLNALLFFLILIIILEEIKSNKLKILITSILLLITAFRNMEFYYNTVGKLFKEIHWVYEEDKYLKSLIPKDIYDKKEYEIYHSAGFLNFKQFYAVDLFKEIKNSINKDIKTFKIINLGIHPSLAQFNGFYSVDGYIPNFPIRMHKSFKKLNLDESKKEHSFGEKNITINNGLYLISSELSKTCNESCFKKAENLVIQEFNPDLNELKKMKVEYLFSAAEIKNPDLFGFTFQGMFQNENYPYIIFLYKLI